MGGGEISHARKSKNTKKKFKARQKKRLAKEALQKAEEEARQKEQLIEYFKCEQLKILAKRYLEGEITERSVILEMAQRRSEEHGISLDFENYDPNSPYLAPKNNPYYCITDDEEYDSEERSE